VIIIKTTIETIRKAMKQSNDRNIIELEKRLNDQQLAILIGLYRLDNAPE
jgi:hypothetical protein